MLLQLCIGLKKKKLYTGFLINTRIYKYFYICIRKNTDFFMPPVPQKSSDACTEQSVCLIYETIIDRFKIIRRQHAEGTHEFWSYITPCLFRS